MSKPQSNRQTRRDFLAESAAAAALLQASGSLALASADPNAKPHQATGVRVGEVTQDSAIIWTRLTRESQRNTGGVVIPQPAKGEGAKKGQPVATDVPAEKIEGACPGAAGRMRVRYSTKSDFSDVDLTAWEDVTEASDFTHQFKFSALKPNTQYYYSVDSAGPGGLPQHGPFTGRFETAPLATEPSNFRFCVMTCQGYPDRDHAEGHNIYPAMQALNSKFISLTGDLVYYDNDEPRALNTDLARLHWERMFSLPRLVECLRHSATYWLKDDHDTLRNDAWPGNKFGLLSWDEGQKIFHQQAPLGSQSYRTIRWGRDLQIWLTDGRDFRSANNMPDGPDKTIWGEPQKAWFKKTVAESNATWKVLISPTPLVGPDRGNKNDNHANQGFAYEGDELRTWLQKNVPENFFVLCGDRHWQYHSVHPTTGVKEFSVGAASDKHAGGSPGEDPAYHKFHRVKGGFLSVTLKAAGGKSTILFEHRDVHGEVVYHWQAERAVTS